MKQTATLKKDDIVFGIMLVTFCALWFKVAEVCFFRFNKRTYLDK